MRWRSTVLDVHGRSTLLGVAAGASHLNREHSRIAHQTPDSLAKTAARILGTPVRASKAVLIPAGRPVYRLDTETHGPLLLKLAASAGDTRFVIEADIVGALARRDIPAQLRGALPEVLGAADGIGLVTRFAPEAEPFGAVVESGGLPLREPLLELARILGQLHSEPSTGMRLRDAPLPPVAPITDLAPAELAAGVGRDYRYYVAAIQRVDGPLRELLEGWRTSAVIHGDLHCANVLVRGGANPLLIDWELSGLGDPSYDAGVALGSLLEGVLLALRAPRDANGARLGGAQPANLAGCAETYQCELPDSAGDMLATLRWAGVALLISVRRRLERTGVLTGMGEALLASAHHLLTRPEIAAHTLALRRPAAALVPR